MKLRSSIAYRKLIHCISVKEGKKRGDKGRDSEGKEVRKGERGREGQGRGGERVRKPCAPNYDAPPLPKKPRSG